jgi:tetratricopeptide (TPR) repeat protein
MPALVIALAVAGIGAFATLLTMFVQSRTLQPQTVLHRARIEMAARRFELARRLAMSAPIDTHATPQLEAERQWLLGEIQFSQAESLSDPRVRRKTYERSVRHLELSVQLGLPPRLVADGQARLGLALYHAGRYAEAADQLELALKQQPARAREFWYPLAESQLRSGSAPSRALDSIDRLLDASDLSPSRRIDARLLRAEALAGNEQWAESEAELEQLATMEAAREPALLKGFQLRLEQIRRMLREPSDQADEATARGALRELIEQLNRQARQIPSQGEGPIRYLLGDALRLAGRNQESLMMLATVRQNRRGSGEAIAANLVELELYVGQGQLDEALETAGIIIREVGDVDGFDPTWITMDQFRQRLVDAIRQWQQARRFEQAIQLVRALPPLLPVVDALRLEGELYRDWAQALDDPPPDMPPGEMPPQRAEARSRYRSAGDALAAAAELKFESQQYSELLWSSIEAYQLGRAYERSLQLLEQYLHYEHRELRPRGLLAKGNALLAIAKPAAALTPLQDLVVDFPRDPLRFDARVTAALAQGELGEFTQASQLLEDNLYDPGLGPASPHWRQSLMLLGDMQYRQAYRRHLEVLEPRTSLQSAEEIRAALAANQPILESAIERLAEAVQRDAGKRSIRRAMYLCAQARRLAAQWPALQAAAPATLDVARRQLNQQKSELLEAALQDFQRLRIELNDLQENATLAEWERAILRNSYLAEADSLFDLARYEEAADAYRAATHRFLGEPLALEAMTQEARCYRELGRNDDAQRVLKQAEQILNAIAAERDVRFNQLTRYDRAGWDRLLSWMAAH